MSRMMPLVVFDLDGTLVDSRQDLADSTNAMLESLDAAPLHLERVVMMVGEGARVLVQRALQAAAVVAFAGQVYGGHVGGRPAGGDGGHRDAFRAEGAGE